MNPPKKREWIIYEENRPKVLHDLKNGQVDYIDITRWDFLDRFFAFLISTRFFEWCSSTYPSPRVKQEVPVWFLLACAIQMKLHTEVAFHKIPFILKSGAILSRVKFNIGLKNGGFNYKNKKSREIPIDFDTVRKYYKDTNSVGLMEWFNRDVSAWFRRHRGFEKEGLFILDLTLLPVPDNPNYEGVAWLPLDKDRNYVDVKKLSPKERRKFKYTPCYALTSLLHTNLSADYFLYAGCHLGSGKESGLREGEKLVDNFVARFGKGVIKLIIADRGFIDGEMITRFKSKYKIDVLIPIRSNMDVLIDAIGLASVADANWEEYSVEKDKDGKVLVKEEVIAFDEMTIWEECKVPLYVALMRKTDNEGKVSIWGLCSTKVFKTPGEAFTLYHKRSQIEERHRQLKECWRLNTFKSTSFSLVAAHVVFVLLVYSLLQMYLKKRHLQELANRTITTLRHEERVGTGATIVYSKGYFATFSVPEYTDIILNLNELAHKRLARWVREFRKRDPP